MQLSTILISIWKIIHDKTIGLTNEKLISEIHLVAV